MDELAERYEVSAVPYFTFHAKGLVVRHCRNCAKVPSNTFQIFVSLT